MFTLPKLKYPYDAFEPYIDTKTMEIHYSKHHQNYVNKLNEAIEKHPKLGDKKVEDLLKNLESIPEDIRTAVKNNGGGHASHSLFWDIMSPEGGEDLISTALSTILIKKFKSLEEFKKQFNSAAMNRFGSGWAWLVLDNNKELKIISTANQDSPFGEGYIHSGFRCLGTCILFDGTQEYIDSWWNIVNWEAVSKHYSEFL
jgi:Fe-Mn family superoxide dismutase